MNFKISYYDITRKYFVCLPLSSCSKLSPLGSEMASSLWGRAGKDETVTYIVDVKITNNYYKHEFNTKYHEYHYNMLIIFANK